MRILDAVERAERSKILLRRPSYRNKLNFDREQRDPHEVQWNQITCLYECLCKYVCVYVRTSLC